MHRRRALVASVSVALQVSACGGSTLDWAPGPAVAATCPAEGCKGVVPSRAGSAECSGPSASCGEADAPSCTDRALDRWSMAHDDHQLACVSALLVESCHRGDARGCSFAGRLFLRGLGVPKNEDEGLALLARACDDGEARGCVVAIRFLGDPNRARVMSTASDLRVRLEAEEGCLLGQPDDCYKVGLAYSMGERPFPEDRPRGTRAYRRGCDLGEASACNNLGDAFAYGDGVPRDLAASAGLFERACKLGTPLGCSNLGTLFEHGAGLPRSDARARALYAGACMSGDVYGCLHADMLSAEQAGAPRDPDGSLAHWTRLCDRDKNARACTFLGILYEDGPDGLSRDPRKSSEAMARGCRLGDRRACEWSKLHGD